MKRTSDKTTIKRVFALLRPYSALAALSLLLAAASVAATLCIPVFVGRAIDAIIGKDNVDLDAVRRNFIMIAAFAGSGAILQWIMSAVNNRVAFHAVRDIRAKAIRKIQKTPFSALDGMPQGDIVSRVTSDVEIFADGLLFGFTRLFTGAATIVGTFVFMLRVSVPIAFIVAVLTPVTLFTARFIAVRTHRFFGAQAKIRGEQTAFVDETLTNQKIIKTFGKEKDKTAEFEAINASLRETSFRATFFSSLTNPTTRFVNGLIYAAVAAFGALTAISTGGITVGGLSAFLNYAGQYAKPFNEISGVITELRNALACGERIFALVYDMPGESDASGGLQVNSGEVRAEKVCFSYDKTRPLIEDLDITAKPGERIAIVGRTGCGKTTIINLLMRFYDVDSGAIRISGTDIRDISRAALRSNYGMVLQDTWIKRGTVRDNIAFGKPGATDEEIRAAAEAAHADGFISRLPQGYDTLISDEYGLSQGERQLICIARVMLAIPPMLILDEATSSIDTRTELYISDAFARMMKGRTSFVVAHRLSTIRDADMILMMKDGRVVEQGSHSELLSKNGEYAGLYNSQFN